MKPFSPSPSSILDTNVSREPLPQAKAVHPSLIPPKSQRTHYKKRTKRKAGEPRTPRKYDYVPPLGQITKRGVPLWIRSPR